MNEQDLIAEFVTEAHAIATNTLSDFEFILVDDGSTDRTGAIMEELASRLPRTQVVHNPGNLGLGRSYVVGLERARCSHYMLLCGDGGVPAESLPAILAKLGSADMVLPYILNLRTIKTPLRHTISRAYTGLLNRLFGLNIRYYNGLPVHRTDLLRGLTITSEGFGFQAEIIIKLILSGHTYTEVGVLGSERSHKSKALKLKNIASVMATFATLIRELRRYRDRSRAPAPPVEQQMR